MLFSRFGVTLERMEPRHLERVRTWRNSPWVRPYMLYREVVGPEDQERWFAGLDPRLDWYFVARAGRGPFALMHVKAVDWSRGCGEAGGFVGDPELLGRPEPAQATLALMDFAFLLLRLRSLEARYRADLDPVVRFNEQLGYRVLRQDDDGFLRARLSPERYLERAAASRRAAVTLHGTGATLVDPDPWLAGGLSADPPRLPPDFDLRLISSRPLPPSSSPGAGD